MGLLALILSLVLDSFGPWTGRAGIRQRAREAREEARHDAQSGGADATGATRAADVSGAGEAAGAGTPEWRSHPLTPAARWLIARFAEPGREPGAVPVLGHVGWAAVIGLPVLAVALLEWLAWSIFSPLVLVLHVAVLSLTVTLGPFYRRFSELRLLIGAGETVSADALIRRWERRSAAPGDSGPVVGLAGGGQGTTPPSSAEATTNATTSSEITTEASAIAASAATALAAAAALAVGTASPGATHPVASDASADSVSDVVAAVPGARPAAAAANAFDPDEALNSGGMPGLERRAIAQSLLVCYRDVFAPLFWYLVLPGAAGAVLVHFARQAAVRSSGRSRELFAWIDWIPLRLIGLVFALVGKFEETIEALRAVSPVAMQADHANDPYAHQRLVLLPVAGASTGLALADALTATELRHAAPDLELPVIEPEAGAMKPAAGLLGRSAVVLLGIYILIIVLD